FKKVKQRAWFRVFGPGKFTDEKYKEAKEKLIAKLHDRGYRDAEILRDSVYRFDNRHVNIDIDIYEGRQYFYGDISWQGNAKYSDSVLQLVLGIEKGDVFSEEKMNLKLKGGGKGTDVSTLYLDDGYLTFNVEPVQTRVYGDTIDVAMRIAEGPQYTVNRVIVKGNDITNDRVVMREIHTKPGQKFSKTAIMRSTRQIAQL